MSNIATVQQIAVTAITPLHISAGGPELIDGLDYVSAERVYVIDMERMLEGLSDDRLRRAESAERLGLLLNPAEWQKYARYSLPNPTGSAKVPQVIGQIKDAFGKPYLPGSSLKGPIRTALAWHLLSSGKLPVDERDLRDNPRFADDTILGGLFGGNPYRDLFRAMQVADSAPIDPTASLDLLRVSLYTLRGKRLEPKGEGWSFFVECLRPKSELRLRLRLDDYLLSPGIARRIPFEQDREFLSKWLTHCHAFSAALIADEQNFYATYGPPELKAFYDDLAEQSQAIVPGHEALLQMSWGAGWLSKTVGMHLTDDEMAMVRGKFRLGRREVDEFPKTRRIVERGGGPSAPLGWVRLRLLDDESPPVSAPVIEIPPPPPPVIEIPPPLPTLQLKDLRAGQVLAGIVLRITDNYAYIDVGVGHEAQLHISLIARQRPARITDVLQVGQRVRVKVQSVDTTMRKVMLTMRDIN